MDLAEIATIMGIPEGTVKSRLFTARKQMKEFLDNLEK
jgi:DNA-directed RNA polymerase specialized sigma24 family protein